MKAFALIAALFLFSNLSQAQDGRDIVTGLPVEREIPTRMVDESLEEHFNTIIDNVIARSIGT